MWKRLFARFQQRRRNAWRVDCHSLEWARLTGLDGTTFRLVRYFMSADIWSRRRNFFGWRRRKIPAEPSRFTAWVTFTWGSRNGRQRGGISKRALNRRRNIRLRYQN